MRAITTTSIFAAIALLCGCVAELPRHADVVTMKAAQTPPTAYPGAGTVWRLDEKDLKALSPTPIAEPPPPPRHPPPPRPNAYYPPPGYYYGPPAYYGPSWYWQRW